jgi:YVTN family beta-propeller protein
MNIPLTFPKHAAIAAVSYAIFLALMVPLDTRGSESYEIFVSNEKGGTLTVIDGSDFQVITNFPIGKRPRGIHASLDGKTVYVALSGTPIEPPPKLDANGNPIFLKGYDDDDDDVKSDKTADGIGIIDVAHLKFLRKINAGSDPEQFCVSADGRRLYISNEDVGAATVLDPLTDKVITFIPVTREPEGSGVSPDGKFFYITCETGGDVFAIDAQTFKIIGHIKIHPRPRNVDFLPDGSRAFIPSESYCERNVIDTASQTLLKVITLPLHSRPQCVKVSADGKYLFAANGPSDDVSVIDLATEKEITRIKSPGSPWGVVAVPMP